MSKTIYIINATEMEVQTKAGKAWTEEDLLADYNSRVSLDPQEIARFEDEYDAYEYYNNCEPDAPYEMSANVGKVLIYEVIEINEVVVDEDGEEIEFLNSEFKTTPYAGDEY